MEFVYSNLDTGKDVQFKVDDSKKIIAIYGKNGVGKTTFSIADVWDKKYVFNEIFVRQNIYVTNDSGVKATSANNKNLSLLFIGDKIVKLQNQKEFLDESKKVFGIKHKEHLLEIKKKFKVRIEDEYIETIINEYKETIDKLDPFVTFDNLVTSITDEIVIDSVIKTEELFKQEMTVYDSQDKLQAFIKYIQSNTVLNSIILDDNNLDKYYELLNSIEKLKKLLEHKKNIDDYLRERNVSITPTQKFIDELIKMQSTNDNCVICGMKNRKTEVSRWKKLLSNEFHKEKNKVRKLYQEVIETIKNVKIIQPNIETEIPNTIQFLTNIESEVQDILRKLEKDDLDIDSTLELCEFEQITKDTADLKRDLVIYIIAQKKQEIIGSVYQLHNTSEKINEIKSELNKNMEKQKNSIMSDVNEILSKMQIERRIKVELNRSGGNYKYKYSIDGKQVDTLSEGQRHKLALAFFIASIKLQGLKDKTVILDDPVISLDELGYHVLKQLVIDLRILEESLRVIVLTHNIFYLYIQLSNIFHNDVVYPLTAFYRMNSDEVREYDMDVLRLDDIALFKKCFDMIDSEDRLLILSGIAPKILRHMLDFKIRLKGLMFNDKPVEDIESLDLNEEDNECLRNVNKNINKWSKKLSKYNSKKALEIIEQFQLGITILGFGEYLTQSDIDNVRGYVGTKNIQDDLSGGDIYFDMIDAVNDVLYRGDLPELRDYISHPRQQITKQITSLSSDF